MKVHNLNSSSKVLISPSGDYDLGVLVNLIGEAREANLNNSSRVNYFVEERIKNMKLDSPAWVERIENASLITLKTKYKKLTGKSFNYDSYKRMLEPHDPESVFEALMLEYQKIIKTKKQHQQNYL